MKKFLKIVLVLLIFMPCVFLFSACSSKTVVDISKSPNSTSDVSIYTVTYSDGSTSSFEVEDGNDGKDLKIEDIFEAAKDNGFSGNFNDFLSVYLSFSVNQTQSVNEAMLSSVSVVSEFPILTTAPKNYEKDITFGKGAGVIYKLDKDAGNAYVITNYHVVYFANANNQSKIASSIKCFLYGADATFGYKTNALGTKVKDANGYPIIEYAGNAIQCEYMGGSMTYDIAVLKVTNSNIIKNNDCKEARLENSNNITVGSDVYAIGNPNGEGISVTKGIVSVDSEILQMTAADGVSPASFRVIRIDAAVNSGNSGGGLFDINGKLVGIVNAKIIDSAIENIGYAIPSNIASRIADNIIKNCNELNKQPQKTTIGISLQAKNVRAKYDATYGKTTIVEDVYISSIQENSLASASTLQVGDRILSVTVKGVKYPITRTFHLIDLTWMLSAGDVMTFEIDGKEDVSIIITPNSISNVA